MHEQIGSNMDFPVMKIENFGDMQTRYKTMRLNDRAKAVIDDADAAVTLTKNILGELEKSKQTAEALSKLRNNAFIISRIRTSEAKSALMDESVDFIKTSYQKLVKWQKTLEHIAQGKTKAVIVKETVPEHLTVAGASSYLALVKLVIQELIKLDEKNKEKYDSMLAELRRCTTIISDCEYASEMNSVVLH